MTPTPFDPLAALDEEVERFTKTNLFTPMEVTGFYLQARCVVGELKRAREELQTLRARVKHQSSHIKYLEQQIDAYEEDAIP